MFRRKLEVVALAIAAGLLVVPSASANSSASSQHAGASAADAQQLLVQRWRGQTEFNSRLGYFGYRPPIFALETDRAQEKASDREVEQADIVRYDAERGVLFALNPYRGLQVLDVSAGAHPRVAARLRLEARPVEMFLRGAQAIVLADQPWRANDEGSSWLRVFDTTDPNRPTLSGQLDLRGTIAGSHLLTTDDSAIVYAVTQRSAWVERDGEWGSQETTWVTAIDVTAPCEPIIVDSLQVPGFDLRVHVDPRAAILAGYDWATDTTTIRYVDISDETGTVELRGSIAVAGRLQWGDRGDLQLDLDGDVLRVASELRGDGGGDSLIRITTIDALEPDDLRRLGSVDVGAGHRLLAARFAGDSAYLFHAVRVDPLEIIDLGDPNNPQSLGMLEIDGWVDHIETIGDRLLTIGIDTEEQWRVAMILFDVADPGAPVELDRAVIGDGWNRTDALYDLQSFRFDADRGLALFPVRGSLSDGDEQRFGSWMQLVSVDFETDTVEARGAVEVVGGVRRALPIGDSLVAFGDLQLEILDVSDFDRPAVTARVPLARNASSMVRVGDRAAVLIEPPFDAPADEPVRLQVSGFDALDDAVTGDLALTVRYGQPYALDSGLIAVAGTTGKQRARIDVVDARTPGAARLVSSIDLVSPADDREFRYLNDRGAVVGETLAVVSAGPSGPILHLLDLRRPEAPVQRYAPIKADEVVSLLGDGDRVFVSSYRLVDEKAPPPFEPGETLEPPVMSDGPDRAPARDEEEPPPLATNDEPNVPDGEAGDGNDEPVVPDEGPLESSEPTADGRRVAMLPPLVARTVAWSVRVVDLARPGRPDMSGPISVPGELLGVKGRVFDGLVWNIFYTADSFKSADGTDPARGFDTLLHPRGFDFATLLDIHRVPNEASDVFVEGYRAAYTVAPWTGEEPATLHVLDLRRAASIEQAAVFELEDTSGARLAGLIDAYAQVRSGSDLAIIDVLRTSRIGEVARFYVDGWWGQRFVYTGRRLLLAAGYYGVYDLSW